MLTDEQLKKLREEPPAWTQEKATDPQKDYVRILCDERQFPEEKERSLLMESLDSGQLTKGAAGEAIGRIKKYPYKKGVTDRSGTESAKSVPAGHYALKDGEDLRFYTVWRAPEPNERIVRVYLQHGPDETQLSWREAKRIVHRIYRMGAAESMALYGREIKRCGKCHQRLTNRVSRAIGIGPICGGRMFGDAWGERYWKAREEIIAAGLDPDEEVEWDG